MSLLISKAEWARLVKWTDENKEDPEAVRRREYIKRVDAQSREMTKEWPNSLENVSKRNEEMRRARLEVAEQANFKFYRRYVKRKMEEEDRLMYNARNTIFKNKDAPKLLLSAVIESVVLKERELQIEFDRELKRQEAEEKRMEDEAIERRAKEWHELQAQKMRKRREVNKQHEKKMFEYANTKREQDRREAAEELARQKQDQELARKEIKIVEAHQEALKAKAKQRIYMDLEESRKDLEARRHEQAVRSKMEDQLMDVVARSQHTIECRRKETVQQAREEQRRVMQLISKRVAVGTAHRDAKEQASLEKAQAERLAAVEARHQATLAKKAKIKADGIAEHEKVLKAQAQRQHEIDTFKAWDLMNRFKNVELYEDYKENLKQVKARKIQEFRDNMIRQKAERDERDARAAAEIKEFYGAAASRGFRQDDNRVFTHARELLREARENGRPERPILKALDRYCKHYRLYPMPDLCKPLQAHFPLYEPRDGSILDPAFRLPTPPPPDKGPDAVDDDEEQVVYNGLQDLIKLRPKRGPREKVEPVKEATSGATNGLQPVAKKELESKEQPNPSTSKNPKNDTLPSITVVPCCCKK